MESRLFLYKNFKNTTIKNKDGDTLGEVHDVVLNLQNGRIAYVLLASGGFLGMGEKYLPVPYEALYYNPDGGTYQMDIAKDKLQEAPRIDINNWPDRPDRKYVDRVYEYYGYKI
jgi:sporulation protein YlmC with PRC-barrel domain